MDNGVDNSVDNSVNNSMGNGKFNMASPPPPRAHPRGGGIPAVLIISLLTLLSLVLVLVICAPDLYPLGAAGGQATLAEFTDGLDARVPALMERYDIPGVSLALVHEGRVSWSRAYGYADLEGRRMMTPGTPCMAQSISKAVTAWGVMKLVQEGLVELDRPVVHYLEGWEFPPSGYPAGEVTVGQLLSHSAGLPLGTLGRHYSPGDQVPPLRESLSQEAVLVRGPGPDFHYSNTGFNLLEILIEDVTGEDFAGYLEKEVLVPLGMRGSSFTWREDLDPPVPFGHGLNGDPVPVYVYGEKASGGLFASAEDIAAFVAAGMLDGYHTGHGVLLEGNISYLYLPQVKVSGFYGLAFDSYGLGHFLEDLPGGRRAVSHGGQGYGWMTHFHSIPEAGEGIVILTNSQRSWPLIAYIIKDWGAWLGYPSLGMGNIIRGEIILKVLVGLVLLGSLAQLWQLGKGIVTRRRHFAPLSRQSRSLRLAQSGLSILLLLALGWSINQGYSFLHSVFPVVSRWLEISLLAAALVLFLSGLFPLRYQRGLYLTNFYIPGGFRK